MRQVQTVGRAKGSSLTAFGLTALHAAREHLRQYGVEVAASSIITMLKYRRRQVEIIARPRLVLRLRTRVRLGFNAPMPVAAGKA